ncbi:protein zwilch homolog isoform X2 [Varanus komodoensis]|uniref:protein zwilch homolog isoform X2 n=1 Tax=Varanus komodoensis TaxID=61221 RepID=UPI001CF7A7F1|nr:protein zwilch homolog isoform X2 [Varanus komodoensis]
MDARQRLREPVLRLQGPLLQLYEEGKKNINKGPCIFETDLQGYLIGEGCASPLDVFWDRSGVMFVVEKVRPCEAIDKLEDPQTGGTSTLEACPSENSSPLALPISRARQLISFYTMSQNPNMNLTLVLLPPLWVRCDRSDLKQTIWLGAEPLSTGNKIIGINLYTVTCKGPVSKKKYSADLEELKEMHRMRHHSSNLTVKGFARYEFLDATPLDSLALEDTLISLERNIYVDFAWNTVTKLLQTPSLTSAATLKVQMASGSPLSSVYELSRELAFLLHLGENLKTGLTDWPKPVGGKPAVELVQKLLEDLKDEMDGLKTPNKNDIESPQSTAAALPGSMKTLFSRRGDLDFVELLWCKMWGKVTSYAELVECFSQVMKAIQHGALQTWVHQGSSSLLSKLIKQSYYGSVDTVPLRGVTPVQMLLEIGVDKMKRDYVSYFVGKEFAIRTHLDYFMSTSVDLQEQIHRVQKLHHMLEIVDNCVELLKLEHESLIFLTQSCINYYKENPLNEKHVFQLPVRATLVKEFYQNAHPQVWRVEISSGRGQGKVTTAWQLSTTPPAEHLCSSGADILDTEACGSKEEMSFVTLLECSQVPFA